MRKSLFAGLTVLDPDESITEDNGAFTGRDRDLIDRFLEIGVKTHRHDARPGLTNPNGAPSAAVLASGGTIPSDLTLTVGYTLEDNETGETIVSPTVTVSTPPPLDPPLDAPDAAINYGAGQLEVDTYYYGITYLDGLGGETPLGPSIDVEREPGFTHGRVLLTSINQGMATASAAAWRLYRAVGGGDFSYLASGTGASFTDDGTTPVNCDIHPPPDEVNTTNQINRLEVDIPTGGVIGSASLINVYVTETGDFEGDTLIEQFPVSSAGQSVIYTSLDYLPIDPPDVNTSKGGASKIDPDTEILDWHWKRPVAGTAFLGSGGLGDVRLDTNSGKLWGMLRTPSGSGASQWTWLNSGAAAAAARGWASATLNLASGASGEVSFGSNAGQRLLRISTSKSSRVRVYTDDAARDADAGRAIGTDPTGDHGLLLDYRVVPSSGATARISPHVDSHNLESPVTNNIPISIANFDSAGDVVVAFLFMPTETV